jgi:PEP-CTERM motif
VAAKHRKVRRQTTKAVEANQSGSRGIYLDAPAQFTGLLVDNYFGGSNNYGVFQIASTPGDYATAAPEPSTWAMLGLGFAGFGFLGFRRRAAAA